MGMLEFFLEKDGAPFCAGEARGLGGDGGVGSSFESGVGVFEVPETRFELEIGGS